MKPPLYPRRKKRHPARGRPSLLDLHEIDIDDLEEAYLRLGTYNAVAREFLTTKTTIMKYIGKKGKRKRGRKKGVTYSRTRKYLESHPEILLLRTQEAIDIAKSESLSPSYMRNLVAEKKQEVKDRIIKEVKKLLKANVAIRDTKGRFIPTAAIRYVWIPRWSWGKPVFVRVILKDRSKAKIPTLFVPDVEMFKK